MKTGKETIKLVVREDDATGETGFVISSLPNIDDMPSVANDPYLIAHDLIEHVNGSHNIGGIGEELQAMGGIWNTRGKLCDMRRNNTEIGNDSIGNVARDITEMLRRFLSGEPLQCTVPPVKESDYSEDLDEIWNKTSEDIKHELDEDERAPDLIATFKTAFYSLFELGLEKHVAQYGGGFMANNLFYSIVIELEELDMANPEPWDEIEIVIDYDEVEATAGILEPMYEEEDY